MTALMEKLPVRVRQFVADRGGNTAILFALATVPLLGFVGAAVDYSHANSIKAAMQAAADSTALAMSKTAGTLSQGDLQTTADAYFRALFTRPETQNLTITTAYSTNDGTSLTVNASGSMKTDFMKVMGFQSLNINATGTAAWSMQRLRVALALDTTGSMASAGKLTALKSATKNLLNQLKNAARNNGDVYVSIIPFSKDVNVGSANYTKDWIDWTDWNDRNGSCSKDNWWKQYSTKSACLAASGKWTSDNHNTWNGCVTDRGKSTEPDPENYDQKVVAPVAGKPSSQWPADQDDGCPKQMMGLSYDWTSMNSLVDQLYADGNTNQPIGLVWAWQSLVGGAQLSAPAMDPKYTYQQVIILLSDGLNTEDRWYSSQFSIDKRMYDSGAGTGTCPNIKAANITIYTIHVNTDGDPTSTLLKSCASKDTDAPPGPKFFTLTSASQIVDVFTTIGTNLSQLRISK